MSVVAGVVKDGVIYMGADSYVGDDYRSDVLSDPKLFRLSNVLLGVVGSMRIITVLATSFKLPPRSKRKQAKNYIKVDVVNEIEACLARNSLIKDDGRMDGDIIIGYEGVLYIVDDGFGCSVLADDYYAIGSASEYALGSLFGSKRMAPLKRIQQALEASCHHSKEARKPIVYEIL